MSTTHERPRKPVPDLAAGVDMALPPLLSGWNVTTSIALASLGLLWATEAVGDEHQIIVAQQLAEYKDVDEASAKADVKRALVYMAMLSFSRHPDTMLAAVGVHVKVINVSLPQQLKVIVVRDMAKLFWMFKPATMRQVSLLTVYAQILGMRRAKFPAARV